MSAPGTAPCPSHCHRMPAAANPACEPCTPGCGPYAVGRCEVTVQAIEDPWKDLVMAPSSKTSKTTLVWTPEWRDAISSYVRDLQVALRLQDWDITLNFEAKVEDAYAEIDPHENQKRAEISFGGLFADLDPVNMRQTLVHELSHCHLFNLHYLAEGLLNEGVGKKRAGLALFAVNSEIERATDAFADAFAPLLPLPVLPAYPLGAPKVGKRNKLSSVKDAQVPGRDLEAKAGTGRRGTTAAKSSVRGQQS